MPSRTARFARYAFGPSALAAAALTAAAAHAAVPAPEKTPVDIIVSGRTSTLKAIRIVKTGQEVPPNFSNGRVKNTPGFSWYVSRHYALKTDMPEDWARDGLTWAELAYPHAVRIIGREPEGLDARRMVFVYAKGLTQLREATWTDGGFRWHQPGGGVTFDFLQAAYNYPSGSLTYHKRDLIIHENLHLLQACVTGSCYNMPYRFLEGVTYAFANHVYDKRSRRLTVNVLDKPTVNNMYDNALRELAERHRTIADFLSADQSGPLCGLYTQFMWTDPDRRMKWRLWRDELLAARGRDLKATDARLMREIHGDLDRLEDDWKRWLAARRSTFHYVDWGWEQAGDTLWSYGWPQKTPFSQTNILLPLNEPARHDPLVMDYPAEAMPAHLVGPVRRGGDAPAVGALLDFSRNPGQGLCGLAFGVAEAKRPARLPQEAPGQVNVYVQAGRTLVLDGRQVGLKQIEAPLADDVRAAMKADAHRAGLTVTVGPDALTATLRAGAAGAVKQCAASLPLTEAARQRVLSAPSAVIAKDGYHGVTPFFDDARKPPPDLTRPAPPNRWRFAGEDETCRLYRAERTLGTATPASLPALRRRMVEAMDKDPAAQADAMTAYAAAFPKVVQDVLALGEDTAARTALAELIGLELELQLAAGRADGQTGVLARLTGPVVGEVTGRVTFSLDGDPEGPPVALTADRGALCARWDAPALAQPSPAGLHARAAIRWRGVDLLMSARRTVCPSVPRWWVIGPFHNFGGGTADTVRSIEREPIRLDAAESGKNGVQVRWRKCERPGSLPADAENVVDFGKLLGGQNVAAYAAVWVRSDRDADAALAVGSDDGVVVWLNGRRVHQKLTTRGYRSMEDRVEVRLNKGTNLLLVKVTQGGGEWRFCAHLLDRQAGPLAGVEYLLDPPDEAPATGR